MVRHSRYRFYFLAIAFIVSSGCIREDLSDCAFLTLKFKVHVFDESRNAPAEVIDGTQVYVFDSNGYVRTVKIEDVSDCYAVGLAKSDGVSMAAWGNLRADSIEIPVMYKGMSQIQALLKLKKSGEYCVEPPDLFFASYRSDYPSTGAAMETPSFSVVGDTVILNLKRIVSSVTITAKHISDSFGPDTAGCFFVVRGTKDAINFNGETFGSVAAYKPPAYFDAERNLKTPAFKILPQEENEYLTVELHRRNEKLFSVYTDSDGELLRAYAGKQLNIVMDFGRNNVGISVVITPWGETWQDTVM